MTYEILLREAEKKEIDVYEKAMTASIKGLYCDNVIWVNGNVQTFTEKKCILAEELGHYHTSTGNILNQKSLRNRKQEKRARNWAYQKLVPLNSIVNAYKAGIKNQYELAEYLDVIEDFLEAAIRYYEEKHGLYAIEGKYVIYFDPLAVLEMFDK